MLNVQRRLAAGILKCGIHRIQFDSERLGEIKDRYEIAGDVRGIGLMIGVEIVKNKHTKEYGEPERSAILCKASEKGLLLLPAGRSAIRICPPLTITIEQALHGLDIFEDSLMEVSNIKL